MTEENVLLIIYNLIIALLGAAGVGSGVAFIIQIGKLLAPAAFPDNQIQNWRLLLIVISAVFLFFARTFGWAGITPEVFDEVMLSLSQLGALLMPLFIWMADFISQRFYKGVLRGAAVVGKSYSLEAKKKAAEVKEAKVSAKA